MKDKDISSEEKRGKAIRKVKALMELTRENGASESEALSAALAAQRLIAEYGIDEEDLIEARERVVTRRTAPYRSVWTAALAGAVADSFRCRHYLYVGSAGAKQYAFVGRESDVAAALTVYDYLERTCRRLAKKEADALDPYGSLGIRSEVRNSFSFGFVSGIRGELERQGRELMLTVPDEVDEAFGKVKLGKSYRPNKPEIDRSFFDSGRSAGRDAVRSQRLEGRMGIEN